MNAIVILGFFIASASASALPYQGDVEARIYEELVNSTFNGWIDSIKDKDPIKKEFLSFDHPILSGSIKDALVAGFGVQYLSHLNFDINILAPAFEVTYEFPHFEASIANYVLEGLVNGDGELSFVSDNLILEIVIKLNLLKPSENEFKVDLSLDGKFLATGVFHDEEFSEKLTKFVNDFLQLFKK